MTQKELNYVEDAVNHETTLIATLQDFINKLENQELKNFIGNEVSIHMSMKTDLMNLLGAKSNE